MKHPGREKVIEALRQSGGVVSAAARKLNVTRKTVYEWIKVDDALKDACEQIRDETIDLAEGVILKAISESNLDATKFFLRCMGKARGWTEQRIVSGPDGGPVQVAQVPDLLAGIDLEKLTKAERDELRMILTKAGAAKAEKPAKAKKPAKT